jgi:CheY-like chemotaxis protein
VIKVLLVEDNPGDAVLVREALKEAQLTFELAIQEDGESMLRMIENSERQGGPFPDIVLLDLNLPRVGGLQLLERMRKSSRWSQVPIVIASSSDSPKDRQAAAAIGVSGYFRKPSDYEQFMEIGMLVRQLLS